MIAPLVTFDRLSRADANRLLVEWGHKMGPCERGNEQGVTFALFDDSGTPLALAMAMTLIAPNVGGGCSHLTRENTIELARLCAAKKDLNRVCLRLWREFVFPRLGYRYAMSYQDSDLHNGNTYRFDGWTRLAHIRGTIDRRTNRPARNKWVWVWESTNLVSKEGK